MEKDGRIIVYCDGGWWPNSGGVGGWGAVLFLPDGKTVELAGSENPSTNNRMELMGAIIALEYLKDGSDVLLYSDSRYLVGGISGWIDNWKRNGWITSQKQPVRNRELWTRLDLARKRHQVVFKWCRGHSGIEGNERADRLARKGAIEARSRPIDFEKFRY